MPDLALFASAVLAESAGDNPWTDLLAFVAFMILIGFVLWLCAR